MSPAKEENLLYLDNLEEYVFDENRIVTYKWLSLTLGLHINQAKQLLHTFLQRSRNGKNKKTLHCIYQITGVTEVNLQKMLKVCLVEEEKLSVVRSMLQPILSCHVYSVSKAKVQDSGTLFAVDYGVVKDNLCNMGSFQPVKCEHALLREEQLAKNQTSDGTEVTSSKPDVSKPKTEVSKTCATKTSGIAGMIAAAANKKKPVTSKPPETAKSVEKKGPAKSFFGNVKPKEVKPNEAETTKQLKQMPEESRTAVNLAKKQAAVSNKSKSVSKRRRVQVMESSTEEESSDMSDSPSSPPPERSPSPPPIVPAVVSPTDQEEASSVTAKGRRRRRKLVNKTFLDDDGFMVTEKAYASESCTDNSDVDAPTRASASLIPAASCENSKAGAAKKNKTVSPPSKKPKVASPKKSKPANKQAGIMSFFSKK